MKILYFLFFIFFGHLSFAMEDTQDNLTAKKTVVFDLDETLVHKALRNNEKASLELSDALDGLSPLFHIEYEMKVMSSKKIMKEDYLPIPYLREVIQYCIDHDLRVHFFSAASKERNKALVDDIGQTFFPNNYEELKNMGHFVVYSRDNLHKNKKDLGHLGYDVQHTILVDDSSGNVAEGESTFIQGCSGFSLKEMYEQLQKMKENKQPKILINSSLFCGLNHAFSFVGALDSALLKMKENSTLSLREAVGQTQFLNDGLTVLQKINHQAHLITELKLN